MAAALVVGVLLGLFLANLGGREMAQGQQGEKKKIQWEYRTVTIGPINPNFANPDPLFQFNQAGAEGWESAGSLFVTEKPTGMKTYELLAKTVGTGVSPVPGDCFVTYFNPCFGKRLGHRNRVLNSLYEVLAGSSTAFCSCARSNLAVNADAVRPK